MNSLDLIQAVTIQVVPVLYDLTISLKSEELRALPAPQRRPPQTHKTPPFARGPPIILYYHSHLTAYLTLTILTSPDVVMLQNKIQLCSLTFLLPD